MSNEPPDKRFLIWLILQIILALVLGISIGWVVWGKEKMPERHYNHSDLFIRGARPIALISRMPGIITKYNAVPEQTDDTPYITASGQRVREGIIANNCLELGSVVEIDGQDYEVRDRMNSRYGCERFDIFSWDLEEAKSFGAQTKEVIIYY